MGMCKPSGSINRCAGKLGSLPCRSIPTLEQIYVTKI